MEAIQDIRLLYMKSQCFIVLILESNLCCRLMPLVLALVQCSCRVSQTVDIQWHTSVET